MVRVQTRTVRRFAAGSVPRAVSLVWTRPRSSAHACRPPSPLPPPDLSSDEPSPLHHLLLFLGLARPQTKGTSSFGKRHNKTHIPCRRCGRRAYHVQKSTCGACGYPSARKRTCTFLLPLLLHRQAPPPPRSRALPAAPGRCTAVFFTPCGASGAAHARLACGGVEPAATWTSSSSLLLPPPPLSWQRQRRRRAASRALSTVVFLLPIRAPPSARLRLCPARLACVVAWAGLVGSAGRGWMWSALAFGQHTFPYPFPFPPLPSHLLPIPFPSLTTRYSPPPQTTGA